MAASRSDISNWFDEGVGLGATHMLVVCDDYDFEDYPVFVPEGVDVHEMIKERTGTNMQRLMEVYSLSRDKGSQMNEFRAFHYD